MAKKPQALSLSRLAQCNIKQLFNTTDDLPDLVSFLGQDRAIKSLSLGIGIKHAGFNIFALGVCGQGKRSIIQSLLLKESSAKNPPHDICYINNFKDSKSPIFLSLRPGLGQNLAQDIKEILAILHVEIPQIFESKTYASRIKEIEEDIREKQEQGLILLEKEAKDKDIAILRTPDGLMLALMKNGHILSEEDFRLLPDEERLHKEELMKVIKKSLTSYLENIPLWQKELKEKIKEAQSYFIMLQVGSIFSNIKHKYADEKDIQEYLVNVEKAILETPQDFFKKAENIFNYLSVDNLTPSTSRFLVNVLVDNSNISNAPIVFEDNPNLANLVGFIDHVSHFGALITDFTQIRAGALHKANGGYLILEAQKLLAQPFAYDALKRALRAKIINVENINQMMGFISPASLKPQPIPLDVKVILIGDRYIYYLLSMLDPEFLELFKVAADFDDNIPRNDDNNLLFARLLKHLSHKEGIKALDHKAVCLVMEYASSLAQDRKKLSTHMGKLSDLLKEANYYAGLANKAIIDQDDIDEAIQQQLNRSARLSELSQENIDRGLIYVDSEGSHVGQINAMSIIKIGEHSFGHPVKITARVGVGKSGIINIEREVRLSGSIHSKGVLILSGYLLGHYAKHHPLSINISLVFEQSYSKVDGDSATVAELAVILSALSEVPLKQSMAVTGSMNQHGQVQAVGGINEKIHGFFNVVKQRGFKDNPGVIIPVANVDHLLLHKDIIHAIKENKFNIYPVNHIDEVMEILTDKKTGIRQKNGFFKKGSLNYLVENAFKKYNPKAHK